MFMTIFSTLNLIYVVAEMPITSVKANKMEIFNEVSILLCNYIMTLFLNVAIPE